MSDVSKTNDLIAEKLREAAKRADWYQTGEAKLLDAAADALEAATSERAAVPDAATELTRAEEEIKRLHGIESLYMGENERAIVAEVERAAAARALEEAAGQLFLPAQGPAHYIDIGMAERMSADWLRARAEAYRQERGEG